MIWRDAATTRRLGCCGPLVVALGLVACAQSTPDRAEAVAQPGPAVVSTSSSEPASPRSASLPSSTVGPAPAAQSQLAVTADRPTRRPDSVLVIGDSGGVRLVEGLRRWGEQNGVGVDRAAAGGCSPSLGRWLVRLDLPGLAELPALEVCVPPDDQVGAAEVIVASYQGTLLFEHRLPDGDWTTLDRSADLRADVAEQFRRVASTTPGRLLLLSVPGPQAEWDNVDPAARDDANRIMAQLADELSNVDYVDTGVIDRDPQRYPRSDGLHLDPDGIQELIETVLDNRLFVEVD